MHRTPVEPQAAWLFGRRFWLLCAIGLLSALLGIAVRSYEIATRHANPVEVHLYGQSRLVPGQAIAFRVLVLSGREQRPIAGAAVAVALRADSGRSLDLGDLGSRGSGATDGDGVFVVRGALPADFAEGEYRLTATARAPQGSAEAWHAITVAHTFRILLTSDRPMYQPGQIIHLRALALATADRHPAAGRELLFTVQDGKGNKVFKQQVKASAHGIAAADFALADQVNTGTYQVAVSLGGATAERAVKVERYSLPKFRLELTTDRAAYLPGGRIAGSLRAVYTFGQPVVGARVHIAGEELIERFRGFAALDGITDAQGRYPFTIAVPDSLVGHDFAHGDATIKLEATVTATAGGEQRRTIDLVVSNQPLRIEVVPESGELVRGVHNRVFVVVSTADGQPVPAHLTLTTDAGAQAPLTAFASRLGVAHFDLASELATDSRTQPARSALSLHITAVDAGGQRVEVDRQLPLGVPLGGVLLRPERAVYQVGDALRLQILAAGPTNRVFVDVVKDRSTVMMQSVDIQKGRGALSLSLPPDLTGTLKLCAYTLRGDGEIVRDVRLVQVQPKDDLRVQVHADRSSYAPGGTASLDFAVTHPDGTPAAAALGLVGVDEAVYALYDQGPALEQLYFTLQQELLKPRYELHAHLPPIAGTAGGTDVDEAQTALLAAATQAAATEAWPGTRYRERQEQLDLAARAWFRQLVAAALLAPLGMFALLFLLAAAYGLRRLIHRQPIAAPQQELAELTSATRSLMRGWFFAAYLPLAAAMAAVFMLEVAHVHGESAAVLLIVAVGVGAVLGTAWLLRAARRVRQTPASAQLPLFRKIVATVPHAYLGAVSGLVLTTVGAAEQLVPEFIAEGAWLVGLPLFILYFGLLSVARQTALRQVSAVGWFWLLGSRAALLPVPALPLVLLLTMRATAPKAIPAMAPHLADGTGAPAAPRPEVGAAAGPARVRQHFPETLLWKPEVITDAGGRAHLEVPLADSITTWRLAASAVSARGELGSATYELPVFQDFFVDLELPPSLTQHDEVSVPVSLWNYLDKPQTVRLTLDSGKEGAWLRARGPQSRTLTLAAKATASVAFRVQVLTAGRHTLTVHASGGALSDAVERAVTVVPDGQPVTRTLSGRLDQSLTRTVTFPADAIDGGSDLYVKLYPGAFSQVVEGLDGIFQMPHGCFEQTSSTTYPSVLALDYLRRTRQSKPDLELKALNYIGLGYQRLVSFEVKGGGFEWFGHEPAHNLLTAYGLLEFHDMAQVYSVDSALIERTRRWLWEQQHGGRFTASHGGIAEGAINQYQGAELRATAYIAWAIAESSESGARELLAPTLDWLARSGEDQDPYVLALRAQALLAGGRGEQAEPLLERLAALAVRDKESAYWRSPSEGVTYSRGDSLTVETTGLAVQALLRAGRHVELARHALSWLVAQRGPHGTWGSTQATIAAMRALLAGTQGSSIEGPVQVALLANGQALPSVQITPETSDVYRLLSLRAQLRKGDNAIALSMTGKGDLAYQIVAVHYVPWSQKPRPASEPMSLTVAYDATTVKTDQLLGAHVRVRWNLPGAAPMTLVDLGVPPGFELLAEDLDALVKRGIIARWSHTGPQLVLYLTQVEHDRPVELDYRLRARYPVRARAPASRAYPYYQPEAEAKAPPVELTID